MNSNQILNHEDCLFLKLLEGLNKNHRDTENFFSCFSLKQLLYLRILCKRMNILVNSSLELTIRLGNLDDKYRFSYWIKMCPNKYRQLFQLKSIYDSPYQNIFSLASKPENLTECFLAVKKDIRKIFSSKSHKNFVKPLERIVKCILYLNKEIQYCEEINLIAGGIFQAIRDEEFTFWIFNQLITLLKLNRIFIQGNSGLNLHSYIIDKLILLFFPNLCSKLESIGISLGFITKNWIKTLYGGLFFLEDYPIIFDQIIIDNWIGFYRIGLALTYFIKENARDLSNNELLTLIQNVSFQKLEHPKSIAQKAIEFDFSSDEVKLLEEDYYIDLAEKLINKGPNQWNNEQTKIIEYYTNRMTNKNNTFAKDSLYFQKKIESLENEMIKNKALIDQQKKRKKWISAQIENYNEFKNETFLMIKTLQTNASNKNDIKIKDKIESVSTNYQSNDKNRSNELNQKNPNANLNLNLNLNLKNIQNLHLQNLKNIQKEKEILNTEAGDQSNNFSEFNCRIILQSDLNRLEDKINECDKKIMELVNENYKNDQKISQLSAKNEEIKEQIILFKNQLEELSIVTNKSKRSEKLLLVSTLKNSSKYIQTYSFV